MTEIDGQLMIGEVAEMMEQHAARAHQAFVDKFKPKLTTDDCYTPQNLMDALHDWVAREYGLDKSRFLRPFFPGGDYQSEDYPEGCTVVDNPPFSILGQIRQWYAARGIRYFLFAPAMTCISGTVDDTAICVDLSITYENGAQVPTHFVTNLEPGIALRTAPDLEHILDAINDENARAGKKSLKNYIYPDEIITAAIARRWGHYGIEYRLKWSDCVRISALDAQKECGKTIFGKGLLLSERAALERAALERAALERAARIEWPLSERERALVKRIGQEPETREARSEEDERDRQGAGLAPAPAPGRGDAGLCPG